MLVAFQEVNVPLFRCGSVLSFSFDSKYFTTSKCDTSFLDGRMCQLQRVLTVDTAVISNILIYC